LPDFPETMRAILGSSLIETKIIITYLLQFSRSCISPCKVISFCGVIVSAPPPGFRLAPEWIEKTLGFWLAEEW
jgi:hypothetical protein